MIVLNGQHGLQCCIRFFNLYVLVSCLLIEVLWFHCYLSYFHHFHNFVTIIFFWYYQRVLSLVSLFLFRLPMGWFYETSSVCLSLCHSDLSDEGGEPSGGKCLGLICWSLYYTKILIFWSRNELNLQTIAYFLKRGLTVVLLNCTTGTDTYRSSNIMQLIFFFMRCLSYQNLLCPGSIANGTEK